MRKRSGTGQGDMLQGTLDLLILQSLVLGPAHVDPVTALREE
jgi:hypothetical protein